MTTARFVCTMVEPFGIVELREWAGRERAAGRIATDEPVSVQVVHMDREAEGSCRWCGCRQNETIMVEPRQPPIANNPMATPGLVVE